MPGIFSKGAVNLARRVLQPQPTIAPPTAIAASHSLGSSEQESEEIAEKLTVIQTNQSIWATENLHKIVYRALRYHQLREVELSESFVTSGGALFIISHVLFAVNLQAFSFSGYSTNLTVGATNRPGLHSDMFQVVVVAGVG